MKRFFCNYSTGSNHSSNGIHVSNKTNAVINHLKTKGGRKILKNPIYSFIFSGMFSCLLEKKTMNFKRVFVLLGVCIPLLFVSCVKQKSCDCEQKLTGYFVYLKEPYKMSETVYNGKEKIVAYFSPNEITVPIDKKESGTLIKGYIPPSFRSEKPIRVNICLKWDNKDRIRVMHAIPGIYSLKCIEKED